MSGRHHAEIHAAVKMQKVNDDVHLRRVKLKKLHEATPLGRVWVATSGAALHSVPDIRSFWSRVAFLNKVTFIMRKVTSCAVHCTHFKCSLQNTASGGLIWVWPALHSQHLTFKTLDVFFFSPLSYFAVAYAHFDTRYRSQMGNRTLNDFHSGSPQTLPSGSKLDL